MLDLMCSRETGRLNEWPLFQTLTGREFEAIQFFVAFQAQGGDLSILYRTVHDDVFGIGANGYEANILGLTGSLFRTDRVDTPELVIDLSQKDIKTISVGDFIGAALDENHQLYLWGNVAEEGELLPPYRFKAKNCGKQGFAEITCGSRFVAALCRENKVYAWGCLHAGTLYYMKALKMAVHGPVLKIAAGKSHLAILVDNGDVYTFGSNESYQRGEDTTEEKIVSKLPTHRIVKDVFCGLNSTLCLTSKGELWMVGGNPESLGYLSLEKPVLHIKQLEKVTLPGKVIDLSIYWAVVDGKYQTVFVARDSAGRSYRWNDSKCYTEISEKTETRIFCSPRDVMYSVLNSPEALTVFRSCGCHKSKYVEKKFDEINRKIASITEVIAEIQLDLQLVPSGQKSPEDVENACRRVQETLLNLKSRSSVSTQTDDC
ncbi:Hypothetical protein NTJ_09621 [Nesidiocoris tenuis]|uniref:RCC1 and BTB domain-containing protein 1 n=1 Tax=Nesidiocoris tenuis TaxID=355587 RepID=A0ABN7AXB2_9HEMI|nr:Hypothetical protein NTJ_09621 [Nesidiocoris tenuis]